MHAIYYSFYLIKKIQLFFLGPPQHSPSKVYYMDIPLDQMVYYILSYLMKSCTYIFFVLFNQVYSSEDHIYKLNGVDYCPSSYSHLFGK